MDQPTSVALYRTGAMPGRDPVPVVERAGEVPDRLLGPPPLWLPNISDIASELITRFHAVNRVLNQPDRADPSDIVSELQAFSRTVDKMRLTEMPAADILTATANYLLKFLDGESLY